MSALAVDLRRTAGYIVADRQGRLVGKVECPMYGTLPDVPDALAVKITASLLPLSALSSPSHTTPRQVTS